MVLNMIKVDAPSVAKAQYYRDQGYKTQTKGFGIQ